MRIALDAMGGDFAPGPNVTGAIEALKLLPELTVSLVGDAPRLEQMLQEAGHCGERIEIVPGEWRKRDVVVGKHVPPEFDQLARFMARFDTAYGSPPLSKTRQIQTVGAVHHRFLWIHPFLDGNGRVARLMSHALFKRLDIGTSLWSVARGLARDEARYKALLAQADGPREGDRDGAAPAPRAAGR